MSFAIGFLLGVVAGLVISRLLMLLAEPSDW